MQTFYTVIVTGHEEGSKPEFTVCGIVTKETAEAFCSKMKRTHYIVAKYEVIEITTK